MKCETFSAMSVQSSRPTRVFASLVPSECKKPIKDSENTNPIEVSVTRREIHVRSVGEQRLNPDLIKIAVVVNSLKDTAEDVKNSVVRREEYILQALKNHGVKEERVSVSKSLHRVVVGDATQFSYSVQIVALFADLKKCESLSNFLVEKLEPSSVRVSHPEVVPFDPQRLADLRRETCLLAVANARRKAEEISQQFGSHCCLGPPISVREEQVDEWDAEDSQSNSSHSSLTDLVTSRARIVRVSVTATFELRDRLAQSEINGKKSCHSEKVIQP